VRAYRFRLDSVLRVRQLQERAAAQRLAVAMRELHGARDALDRARRSLEDLAAPVGHLTVGAVEWSHAQSGRMSDGARQRAEEVQRAEDAAHQANQAWGSARQRTAMLERLDERHLALWQVEFDRSEARALDERASVRPSAEISAQ
jgi:flagellar export protein FliJ